MTKSAPDGVSQALNANEAFRMNRNCGMVYLLVARRLSPGATPHERPSRVAPAHPPAALDDAEGFDNAGESPTSSSPALDEA
jgi:hypothetical protein